MRSYIDADADYTAYDAIVDFDKYHRQMLNDIDNDLSSQETLDALMECYEPIAKARQLAMNDAHRKAREAS